MLNIALIAALMMPQEAPSQAAPELVPAIDQPSQAAPKKVSAAQVFKDLFPAPSGPMTLIAGDSENPLTFRDLVRQYGELTDQYFVIREDTNSMLRTNLNLDRSMTVPAEEVQSVFEQLLKHGDFVLTPLTTSGTRIVELNSLATAARNNLRSKAIYLGPDELYLAEQHPAMLVTATVTLPHLDVRQVSNSMRTMITDANTQQMLPGGNSHSMIIVGFGDQVASTISTLQAMDAASAAGAKDMRETMEIVSLTNGNAAQIAGILQSAYVKPEGATGGPGPKFVADMRTNSILITTRSGRIEGIKNLIAALDTK